jgi:hypothetical protein
MADNESRPMRESVIEPPSGSHSAPMPEKPIGTTNARQGVTLGHMRWVLLASLILIVLGFVLAAVFS